MGGEDCGFDLSKVDNATGLNILGGATFLIFLFAAASGHTDFHAVQRQHLKDRLTFVSHMNVAVCLVSLGCYAVHVIGHLVHMDHKLLNTVTYFEYMGTCPLMLISFIILGGPRVKDMYRKLAASLTILILAFGAVASMLESRFLQVPCFIIGLILFAGLAMTIDKAVMEHSNGQERILKSVRGAHFSPYKKLARKILSTWILFPAWWLGSPEGFGLVTDSHEVHAIVKLVLNVVAKGTYILYIRVLQAQFAGKADFFDDAHSMEEGSMVHKDIEHPGLYVESQGQVNQFDDVNGIAFGHIPSRRSTRSETGSTFGKASLCEAEPYSPLPRCKNHGDGGEQPDPFARRPSLGGESTAPTVVSQEDTQNSHPPSMTDPMSPLPASMQRTGWRSAISLPQSPRSKSAHCAAETSRTPSDPNTTLPSDENDLDVDWRQTSEFPHLETQDGSEQLAQMKAQMDELKRMVENSQNRLPSFCSYMKPHAACQNMINA